MPGMLLSYWLKGWFREAAALPWFIYVHANQLELPSNVLNSIIYNKILSLTIVSTVLKSGRPQILISIVWRWSILYNFQNTFLQGESWYRLKSFWLDRGRLDIRLPAYWTEYKHFIHLFLRYAGFAAFGHREAKSSFQIGYGSASTRASLIL